MENASKALLMAGGILIALILIGMLLLMFNRVGSYRQGTSEQEKSKRIAAFNNEFEKYINDGKIEGSDLITLANKIIDFNQKNGTLNYINYDIKMSLTVANMNAFSIKYGYSKLSTDALFKENSYTINAGIRDLGTNKYKSSLRNSLESIINQFNGADKTKIKKMSAIWDKTLNNDNENINKIKEEFSDWNGTGNPTVNQIKNYKEYSEFMTSKFKLSDGTSSKPNPSYVDGQIQSLSFEFAE